MAAAPTEVYAGAVVAGHGPPWCWAQGTATPVGQPVNTTRPVAAEPGQHGHQLAGITVADHQAGRAEPLLRQPGQPGGELAKAGMKDLRRAGPGPLPRQPGGEGLDRGVLREFPDAGLEPV